VRTAVVELPEPASESAIDADDEKQREGAWVAELTDRIDLSSWPEGTRLICHRERPHPGAQFEISDARGYRYTAFLTGQDGSDLAGLELTHRRRARVEDRIRAAKDTGLSILTTVQGAGPTRPLVRGSSPIPRGENGESRLRSYRGLLPSAAQGARFGGQAA